MRTELNELALLEHRDMFAEPAGGQAVGDVDRRFVAYQAVEFGVYLVFCDGVERGRRLIQHDKRCVFIQRPGKGELLRLAAGNFHAGFLHILVKIGIELLLHPAYIVRDARFL